MIHMESPSQESITALLTDAILFLCKNSYASCSALDVDAIICVSAPNSKENHVIKIHERLKYPKKNIDPTEDCENDLMHSSCTDSFPQSSNQAKSRSQSRTRKVTNFNTHFHEKKSKHNLMCHAKDSQIQTELVKTTVCSSSSNVHCENTCGDADDLTVVVDNGEQNSLSLGKIYEDGKVTSYSENSCDEFDSYASQLLIFICKLRTLFELNKPCEKPNTKKIPCRSISNLSIHTPMDYDENSETAVSNKSHTISAIVRHDVDQHNAVWKIDHANTGLKTTSNSAAIEVSKKGDHETDHIANMMQSQILMSNENIIEQSFQEEFVNFNRYMEEKIEKGFLDSSDKAPSEFKMHNNKMNNHHNGSDISHIALLLAEPSRETENINQTWSNSELKNTGIFNDVEVKTEYPVTHVKVDSGSPMDHCIINDIVHTECSSQSLAWKQNLDTQVHKLSDENTDTENSAQYAVMCCALPTNSSVENKTQSSDQYALIATHEKSIDACSEFDISQERELQERTGCVNPNGLLSGIHENEMDSCSQNKNKIKIEQNLKPQYMDFGRFVEKIVEDSFPDDSRGKLKEDCTKTVVQTKSACKLHQNDDDLSEPDLSFYTAGELAELNTRNIMDTELETDSNYSPAGGHAYHPATEITEEKEECQSDRFVVSNMKSMSHHEEDAITCRLESEQIISDTNDHCSYPPESLQQSNLSQTMSHALQSLDCSDMPENPNNNMQMTLIERLPFASFSEIFKNTLHPASVSSDPNPTEQLFSAGGCTVKKVEKCHYDTLVNLDMKNASPYRNTIKYRYKKSRSQYELVDRAEKRTTRSSTGALQTVKSYKVKKFI